MSLGKIETKEESRNRIFEAFHKRVVDASIESARAKTFSAEAQKPNVHQRHHAEKMVIPGLEPQLPEHGKALESILLRKEEIQKEINNLKLKYELLQNETVNIQYIPVLFDSPSFSDVQVNLYRLDSAGISKIKIGEKEYPITTLMEILSTVRDYSLKRHEEGKLFGSAIEHEEYLASLGVTRDKISPFSTLGFRECLLKCLEGDHPAVRVNPK